MERTRDCVGGIRMVSLLDQDKGRGSVSPAVAGSGGQEREHWTGREQRSAVCTGPGNTGKEGDGGLFLGQLVGQGSQSGDERPCLSSRPRRVVIRTVRRAWPWEPGRTFCPSEPEK